MRPTGNSDARPGNHDGPRSSELAQTMADIFISYTAADRDWAFWIAKELDALGHIPHVHEWEIERGGDIYAWMEQRHDAADHVLCVVSDGYLKAPYSTLERNAALWQAASNRPGFVLFVAVQTCKLPTLSDHIRRCELYGVPEDAARIRFREFMAKREAPAAAAFPGKVFAVSNIPIRVPSIFSAATTRWRPSIPRSPATAAASPSPRCTGCAASARPRWRRPIITVALLENV